MTVSSYYMDPAGQLTKDLKADALGNALQSDEGLLWVDISSPSDEDARLLRETFHFHPLAIEDCTGDEPHTPKVDEYDDHLFVLIRGINHNSQSEIVETTELGLFIGSHFVVSCHRTPLYSVDFVRRRVEDGGRPMRRGEDFLAYALMDALIDNVMPTIDRMGEVAEVLEEEVIENPHQSTLQSILRLKRSVLRIHRIMAPQREVSNRLARGEFSIVTEEAIPFYRNIYDHIARIEDLTQSLRERADMALATHLSAVANRQNEVMKVLSVVAAVFLPLSLLAGIYGMNFENMPELKWSWAYFALLGLMSTIALSIMAWIWGRRWMTWGRSRIPRVRPFSVDPRRLLGHVPRSEHAEIDKTG